jgi:hypothetical protein
MTPIAYSTAHAHTAFGGGCSPRAIKSAVQKGELISHRVGQRSFILTEDLLRWARLKPPAHSRQHKEINDGN